MAKTNPDVILLRGDPIVKEYPLAALDVYGVGAILPGYLVELYAGKTVRPHSAAAGVASRLFADQGLALATSPASITQGDKDDPYNVDGQTVRCLSCKPGDEVYVWLEAGTGNVTAVGTLLNSNGAGLLQVGAANPVGRALEIVDNDPGTASAPVRVRIEVI